MDAAPRKPYPTDVSDDEWAFVAPSLARLPQEAGQRRHGTCQNCAAIWASRQTCQSAIAPGMNKWEPGREGSGTGQLP